VTLRRPLARFLRLRTASSASAISAKDLNTAFVELSALVRHSQIACRSVDEANAEPVLEASEAFTHDGERHVHFATGCGKTSDLDDAREDGHIEKAIDHGGPPFRNKG